MGSAAQEAKMRVQRQELRKRTVEGGLRELVRLRRRGQSRTAKGEGIGDR